MIQEASTDLEVTFLIHRSKRDEKMEGQEFKFYLIHRSGYRALGASRRIGSGYLMFRIHHPSANVYDAFGIRKPFECVGGIACDDIQHMLESGEWDIAAENPYNEEVLVETAA